MLFGWTVRRIARRWFPEALLDIGDGRPEPIDEAKVIDVARVEREVDFPAEGVDCVNCVRGKMFLHGAAGGGTYLRCNTCNATTSPPQAVRDAVRGTPAALTLAGAAEPVLEPGERVPTAEDLQRLGLQQPNLSAEMVATAEKNWAAEDPEPQPEPDPEDAAESAVQSEYDGATLDGEDVVVVPAAAEAVIPELDAPDPRAANQAMRDAIYQHWVMPRPTAYKIEMRGLLDEHGWHGDASLGDWLLTLDDATLARVADSIAGFP